MYPNLDWSCEWQREYCLCTQWIKEVHEWIPVKHPNKQWGGLGLKGGVYQKGNDKPSEGVFIQSYGDVCFNKILWSTESNDITDAYQSWVHKQ